MAEACLIGSLLVMIIIGLIALYIRHHVIRMILLTFICAFGIRGLTLLYVWNQYPQMASLCGMSILFYLGHMGHLLCIEGYQLAKTTKGNRFSKLIEAINVMSNGRHVGTKREIGGLIRQHVHCRELVLRFYPLRLDKPTRDYHRRNIRLAFIVNRIMIAAAIWMIYSGGKMLMMKSHLIGFTHIRPADFDSSKQPFLRRLSDVTAREVIIRSGLVLYHNWNTWALCTFIHNIFAALNIMLRLNAPHDWTYLFGNISEAYTVRRYWSRFWHRLSYRHHVDYAHRLGESLFRFRPSCILYGIWIKLFVFGLSGITHAVVVANMGYQCGYMEEIWWYLLNFYAIVAEQVIGWLVGELIIIKSLNTMIKKTLGFIWVFLFMFWSLPKLYYSKMTLSCVPL